jgi:hypothetical protein
VATASASSACKWCLVYVWKVNMNFMLLEYSVFMLN